MAIIYQEFNLLPERTVAENVFLGREPVRRGLVDRAAMEQATARLLHELGEEAFGPRDAVKRLPVAQQQIVEIVKALSVNARLIVMDEPTAALAEHEVESLYRLIGRLRERGVAVVYISHRLREVFDLADRVTVLKDGSRVTTLPIGEVTPPAS
ncbi:ATP-binding cassette domain-containing protein [Nonomuraea ferruginea]